MAKDKEIKLGVKVTTDGSLKELDKKAKKAGKSTASVAKSTAESDRRLKSLSQQTSNATKGFSKQAQTIEGGLVPIYATLAAQVFAVTAAFRFFQDAFDMKNLMEGQKAMGAVTGTAFGFLSRNIQAATSNMLAYRDAAQAAAIGTAAGLSRTQLEQLGTAARNTSIALGRDLTDSFNRLIRGTTKAEPELLDELGIILRLDPALRKYSQAINVAVKDLTPFQRTQAVVNEVLDQAESKFGAVAQILDPDAYALGQFATEFQTLMDNLKVFTANTLLPVVQFFKNNVVGLIGGLLLFIRPILQSILPNFTTAIKAARADAAMAQTDFQNISKFTDLLQGPQGAKGARAFSSDLLGSVGIKTGRSNQLSQQRIDKLREDMFLEEGIFKDMTEDKVKIAERGLKQQEATLKESLGRQRASHLRFETFMQKHFGRINAFMKRHLAGFHSFAAGLFRNLDQIIQGIGLLGIGMMLFDLAKQFGGFLMNTFLPGVVKSNKASKEFTDTLKSLNVEMKKMEEVKMSGLLDPIQRLQQIGNLMSSLDIVNLFEDFNQQIDRGFGFFTGLGNFLQGEGFLGNTQVELIQIADTLEKIDPRFRGLQSLFISGRKITSDQAKEFRELTEEIIEASQASKRLADNTRNIDKAFQSVVDSIAKLPFSNILKPLKAQIKDLNLVRDQLIKDQKQIRKEIEEQASEQVTSGFGFTTTFGEGAAGRLNMINETNLQIAAKKELIEQNEKDSEALQKNIEEYTDLGVQLMTLTRQYGMYLSLQQRGLELQQKATRIERQKLELQREGINELTAFEEYNLNVSAQQVKTDQARNKLRELEFIASETELKFGEDTTELKNAEAAVEVQREAVRLEEARLDLVRERLSIEFKNRLGKSDLALAASERRFGLGLFGFTKAGAQTAKDLSTSNIQELAKSEGITVEEAQNRIKKVNFALAMNAVQLEFNEGVANRLGDALENGIGNALISIVEGTKTAKEAFGEMAKSIVADITKMAIKAAIMTAITGSPAPMGRYGGIMSPAGKGFRYGGYAPGGIASGPESGYQATLHGTEAIVPLGNDRSIPVEFKGGTSGVNNITVNVDASGSSGIEGDQEGRSLGAAITSAVVRELEVQQRPGGLLAR